MVVVTVVVWYCMGREEGWGGRMGGKGLDKIRKLVVAVVGVSVTGCDSGRGVGGSRGVHGVGGGGGSSLSIVTVLLKLCAPILKY